MKNLKYARLKNQTIMMIILLVFKKEKSPIMEGILYALLLYTSAFMKNTEDLYDRISQNKSHLLNGESVHALSSDRSELNSV